MKLISQDQIETLGRFKSRKFLTTSFYLDTKKRSKTRKEITLALKNLLAKAKAQLQKMTMDKEKKGSLLKDLNAIGKYCDRNLASYKSSGLGLFSCSGESFWEEFYLPNSPRNRIVFDQNPYVRPLSAILTEYTRICALVIDRKEAKWYDVFMGEIFLLDSMTDDVLSRTKERGWEDYESKRIEKHLSSQLRNHFKEAAKKTFDLFKKSPFDWLFISCQDEYMPELNSLFHTYIKERLKGRFTASLNDSPARILDRVLELKRRLKIKEKEDVIQTFIQEQKKGGLAIYGLDSTLNKLNRGEVQTLLLTRHFSKPGKICPKCGFLFVDEPKCPICRVKTEPLVDVIDEAVEAAFDKNARVKHINPPSRLKRYGDIAALLRYKT